MDRLYANTVRHFREIFNLTQAELKTLSGISQSELSKLEDGSRWPRKKAIFRLCKALGIPTKDFFVYLHDDLGRQLKSWVEPEDGDYDD